LYSVSRDGDDIDFSLYMQIGPRLPRVPSATRGELVAVVSMGHVSDKAFASRDEDILLRDTSTSPIATMLMKQRGCDFFLDAPTTPC